MVRNTQANLLKIEQVLGEMHSAAFDLLGKQVEIETKFIEINQSTLNELGFNWSFEGKNGGSANLFDNLTLPAQDLLAQGLRTAGGISAPANIASAVSGKAVAFDTALNNSDVLKIAKTAGSLRWSMVINALEQADDTDVLSAPSIVTRDGSEASITVGERRTVSVGFDVSQAESSLFIEHDLESRVMGVQLTVTPELRAEGLVDLKLHPKVIDLIGYEDYQIVPPGATGGVSGENTLSSINTVNAALASRMPYYRRREMTTEVTVADGSTVGMGGLIYDKNETFRDKVPVLGSIPLLGRLFRSEGEKSVKRNLMIFVTATQVDVNGRRLSDLVSSK
jgi:general secretion pathway protein D